MRWCALLLAGCAAGDSGQDGKAGGDGDAGSIGPPGPAGPPGAPGGSYRWHDAAGAQVTEGSELVVWLDDLLWNVDWQTAEILVQPLSVVYYTGDSCDGDAYTLGMWPPARMPMEYRGEYDEPGAIVVRPDDLLSEEQCGIQSIAFGSDGLGCNFSSAACAVMADLSAFYEVDVPITSWVAPLHPEPIE